MNLPDIPEQSLEFNTSQRATGGSRAADLFWRIREFNNTDGDCCAHFGLHAAERYIQGKLFYCSISYRTFFFSGLLAFKELFSIPWFLLVVNSTDAQFLLMH